jgi:hypothetical protein
LEKAFVNSVKAIEARNSAPAATSSSSPTAHSGDSFARQRG